MSSRAKRVDYTRERFIKSFLPMLISIFLFLLLLLTLTWSFWHPYMPTVIWCSAKSSCGSICCDPPAPFVGKCQRKARKRTACSQSPVSWGCQEAGHDCAEEWDSFNNQNTDRHCKENVYVKPVKNGFINKERAPKIQ